MVELTAEMKDALQVPEKGGSLVYLATASRDGTPNIAPMRYVATWSDEKILIADMFQGKTKVNLKENHRATISICHPTAEEDRWYAFEGPTIDVEYGDDFEWYGVETAAILEAWGDWEEKEPPEGVADDLAYTKGAQRGVVVMHVEDAYATEPGRTGEPIL